MVGFFTSDKKLVLGQLRRHAWSSEEELQGLLEKLTTFDLRLSDVLWMIAERDRVLRHYGAQLIIQSDFPGAAATVLKEAAAASPVQRKALVALLPRLRDDEALQRVDPWLEEKDPERRALALDVVLAYPTSQVLAQIVRLLRHEDPDCRSRTLTRLLEEHEGGVPDARARQLIAPLVGDPDERLRIRAIQALARAPDDALIDLLLERLRVETGVVKQVLTRTFEELVQREDLALEDKLIPLLSDGDESIRNIVILLVQHMSDPVRVVKKIILYSKSLMGWMRERIHETIKRIGESLLDPMIELMYHEDPEIRSSALMFASNFENRKMVDAVVHLTRDQDWWTRAVAIDTLGRLGDERAVAPLIEALADEEVRWSAIDALARIGSPMALAPVARLLGDRIKEVRLEVVRALEVYNDARVLPLLKRAMETDPELDVRERALDAYKVITERNQLEVDDRELRSSIGYATKSSRRLDKLLTETRKVGGSDLHLTPDSPPYVRIEGELKRIGKRVFSAADCEAMLREILPDEQHAEYEQERQVDFCYDITGVGRYRANVFEQRLGIGGVFRVIPNEVPTFSDLRLPPHLSDIANYNQGLVVVCGTSGSGKTSTLAALVNLLNETKQAHIITLEDPIEYVHPFKNCLVNQREVKRHTRTFSAALRAALREDPDVIVVGDMRDTETIRLAVTAAETGHLVIATINTTSAVKAVERLVESFPPREQGQVRAMLSESLKVVIGQSLLRRKDQPARVACFEVLMHSAAVSNLIRDNKTWLLPSLMQIGRNLGMCTVDGSLSDLVNAGLVSPEDAYMRAEKKEDFEPRVSQTFLEGAYRVGHQEAG